MAGAQLKAFLDREGIKYVTIRHSPAYTAQEVASATHISGRLIAKTVVVKIEGSPAMVVLPANRKVVMLELREALGADKVKLATEEEFKALFPDCEVGAMPPFGNLYGIPVYVAPALTEDEEIAFNAGSHTEVIRMTYRDFDRLVKPKVIDVST